MAFSNCIVAEGKTVPEAMAATREWSAHLAAIGSKAGIWAFSPGDGNNTAEWDFKIVMSFLDFVAYGASREAFTNGHD